MFKRPLADFIPSFNFPPLLSLFFPDSVDGCRQACEAQTDCWAADFNMWNNSCRLMTSSNGRPQVPDIVDNGNFSIIGKTCALCKGVDSVVNRMKGTHACNACRHLQRECFSVYNNIHLILPSFHLRHHAHPATYHIGLVEYVDHTPPAMSHYLTIPCQQLYLWSSC